MKHALLALSATVLAGCAAVKVSHTDVASGATKPRAIYIRSYIADDANFAGHHGGEGEKPIRRSLAPAEFSNALKNELEKLAPAAVVADDDAPSVGWLVESDLQWVDSGSPSWRGAPVAGALGAGRSHLMVHVRVTDLEGHSAISDAKKQVATGAAKETPGANGPIIYEFDLAGGSGHSHVEGSVNSPGFGYASPFDYKNAAERVLMALSTDPHRYGLRTSPTIR